MMIYEEKTKAILHEEIGAIKNVWQVKSDLYEGKYITAILN